MITFANFILKPPFDKLEVVSYFLAMVSSSFFICSSKYFIFFSCIDSTSLIAKKNMDNLIVQLTQEQLK